MEREFQPRCGWLISGGPSSQRTTPDCQTEIPWRTQKKPENTCCRACDSDYVAAVDWQQTISLGIVAATAAILARAKLRRRKFSLARDTHCGCTAASQSASGSSIVYRARKGERPQVLVKMR
jgi:hypothetical protein